MMCETEAEIARHERPLVLEVVDECVGNSNAPPGCVYPVQLG